MKKTIDFKKLKPPLAFDGLKNAAYPWLFTI